MKKALLSLLLLMPACVALGTPARAETPLVEPRGLYMGAGLGLLATVETRLGIRLPGGWGLLAETRTGAMQSTGESGTENFDTQSVGFQYASAAASASLLGNVSWVVGLSGGRSVASSYRGRSLTGSLGLEWATPTNFRPYLCVNVLGLLDETPLAGTRSVSMLGLIFFF